MIVGFIKVLKFRSLKMAGLAIVVNITVSFIVDLLLNLLSDIDYFIMFLDNYNNPLLL